MLAVTTAFASTQHPRIYLWARITQHSIGDDSIHRSHASRLSRKSLLRESLLSLAEQVLYHLQQTSSATKNRGGVAAMILAERRITDAPNGPRRNAATSACLSRKRNKLRAVGLVVRPTRRSTPSGCIQRDLGYQALRTRGM